MIKSSTVYKTKGKQFDTLKEAIDYRENLIEGFFRDLPGYWIIPPKERAGFIESILSQRKKLIDLLDYSETPEED